MPSAIHHIGIVVRDIDDALKVYGDALELEVAERRQEIGEHVEIAMLPTTTGTIELIRPLDGASGVARFLEKRGEGVHHVCIAVADIERAMTRLAASGARLLSDEPVEGVDGTRWVFVHPESGHGVLIELYEVRHNPDP